jgi:acyl-CoA thioesterase II
MTHDTPEVLGLQQLGELRFRGVPTRAVPTRIFGGQLVAHASLACGRTAPPGRAVHSVHGMFLRPGRPDRPVDYEVEILRDGATLSSRQVRASQDGRSLFQLTASFHSPEPGPAHQLRSPGGGRAEPRPRSSYDLTAPDRHWLEMFGSMFPFEIAFPDEPVRAAVHRGERPAPQQRVLLRWPDLPPEPLVHMAALGFASDALLLSTSVYPHGQLFGEAGVSGSSLDHAIWFHRQPRCDEWLLHEMRSEWAADGRALCTGHVFAGDGELIATVVQEGIIRGEPWTATPSI